MTEHEHLPAGLLADPADTFADTIQEMVRKLRPFRGVEHDVQNTTVRMVYDGDQVSVQARHHNGYSECLAHIGKDVDSLSRARLWALWREVEEGAAAAMPHGAAAAYAAGMADLAAALHRHREVSGFHGQWRTRLLRTGATLCDVEVVRESDGQLLTTRVRAAVGQINAHALSIYWQLADAGLAHEEER